MAERLYILDAYSLIFQVFHAIPEMTGPDGRPTNAVFGFVRDIQAIRQKKPDYVVCAFDGSGDNFRHEIYSDYKANRSAMPEPLVGQIAMIRKVLEAFRIPVLSIERYEADDLLASVAAECRRRNIEALVCTADKDMRQIVADGVGLLDLRKNRIIDREFVRTDWGVEPEQVVDYQAMVGDSVDNVPGIRGVGGKTAASLLQKYGTLENIFEHLDEVPGKKMRENFYAGRQSALMSRELVRLCDQVPLPADWSSWRLQEPDRAALLEVFAECGFHRFADDVRKELPAERVWQAEYVLVKDAAALDLVLAELASADRLSFDLETTSVRPTEAEIVGYALSMKPGKAYYVAVRAPEGQTELDPTETLEKLRPILENPEIRKVGQNLKYDMVVLLGAGVRLAGVDFDSMIASYLLEPGERNHNLDELSQRLLGHTTILITEVIGVAGRGKEQIRMDQAPVEKVCEYAGEDADVALRLTDLLAPKIAESGLDKLLRDLECPLIEVLADMEHAGVRIDPARLQAMGVGFSQRLDELKGTAHQLAGKEFNLDSPTQLRKILFEEQKLPILKRTKTGPSTDQEVLEELAAQSPLCEAIIEHRKLAKLKGTYIDSLPGLMHPRTGRIHASFNQTVAATGRLSSSDPNLQNIPVRTEEGRQIRQAFLPGNDRQVLVSADYSQIELRMLAYFSKDANLRQAFLDDQDIHAVVAAQIEGVSIDDVDENMRRRAKAVNFGIMYGLSPYGLARQLKISQDEAAKFIDAYFEQYPTIDQFFTGVLESARKEGFVRTLLGRMRAINGIKNTTGRSRNLPERTAINTVIQGSAADMIKLAMLRIHHRLRQEDFGARMLLQIHDELVFEVEADRVEPLARMVVEEMTEALPLQGVPLKVDVGAGPNWLDLQPLELEAARA